MQSRRILTVAVSALLIAGVGGAVADAPYRSSLPAGSPEAPLLHGEVLPGRYDFAIHPEPTSVSAKTVDGDPSDWAGVPTNYGGNLTVSAGELVYTDHIFDSFGADDGKDIERDRTLDPMIEQVPETYRIEALYHANLADEVGAGDYMPEQLAAADHYGDLPRIDEADIAEVRVGATADDVLLLVRTTTMTAAKLPGVLVLVDTVDDQGPARSVPFNSGLTTQVAELAVLLAPDGTSQAVDLATGASTPLANVAFRADGWDNAVEASLPRSLVGDTAELAVAAGAYDGAAHAFTNIANVAFRVDEPVRGMYFDKQQAFALNAGTIDPFFHHVSVGGLERGITELPRGLTPGYYDRIFRSSDLASREGGEDGILQHYGLFVPTDYKQGTANPTTFWMHWRGGKAHSAAVLAPRIMRDYGENRGNLVVSPRGRGTSTWYEGKGHIDFLEVWDDVMATYSVDANRVYLTGHSMGGWASYFLASVYPDRFAATMPVEGTVTQGAYFSPVDDQCGPCFQGTNDGDAEALHTYRILDNLRNTPIAIYQGLIDELVPETGTLLQVRKLQDLGYRYRFYQFFQYEHYTHPILDEWAAGAQYMDRFTRDPNPPRVTYVRDMPFERAAETGPDQRAGRQFLGLDLKFDSAYWMSGLTPVDAVDGVARFDGTTFGRPAAPYTAVPDTDAPVAVGQTGPYAVVGQQWLTLPTAVVPAARNAFKITVSGASEVTLNVTRMGLDLSGLMMEVTTDSALTVHLVGPNGTQDLTFAPGTSARTLGA